MDARLVRLFAMFAATGALVASNLDRDDVDGDGDFTVLTRSMWNDDGRASTTCGGTGRSAPTGWRNLMGSTTCGGPG